ncbi:HEPN domain-containing protein [Maribacter aurantiacus]|uniref:Uncharacterized protein n=1 Tax=Maribacter aurantiacus TaxID=1882343 RepID=A0A5R8M410_9FLAO|nr:HEPN domain-containing protein [Maribacter aurantiacus]TLF44265.1 hypothetical protein FEK29_12595 [Maribacter aurantiacus]
MAIRIKSGNRHNLDTILERLVKLVRVEDGILVYNDAFDHHHLNWMLHSLIEFGESISDNSKTKILNKAISTILKEQNHEKEYFIEKINHYLGEHNNQKIKTYYLLAGLSISGLPFRKIKISDSTLRIHGKGFPKIFRKARIKSIIVNRFNTDHPNFLKISLSCDSKNFQDAYKLGIEIFEVFRAFICLLLNKSIQIRFGRNNTKAINEIFATELFTLHNEEGNCPDEKYYWFNSYPKEIAIFDPENGMENIKKPLKAYIRSFNKCKPKHQTTLKKALNIYVTAFDEENKHLCFIKAWTVLETLTNTDQNDLLIKRVSSIFKNKEFVKQDLECLREFRNEFVHQGSHQSDPLVACFRVQKYIRTLVNFNLNYAGFLNNINESALFLDNFTPDLRDLKNRKRILERAITLKSKI